MIMLQSTPLVGLMLPGAVSSQWRSAPAGLLLLLVVMRRKEVERHCLVGGESNG